MSKNMAILTPVGRLVQGSVYKGSNVDIDGRPLIYKSGAQAGQPRTNYWFALAIAKGHEQHWNQTEWGKLIWEVGQAGFPGGQANLPTFAWKIKDGDSQIPNRENKRPCDYEGFPGHWILNFSGSFAPSLFNKDGTIQLTEPNAIQPGDYIQVYGNVDSNDSNQTSGIYLNPSMVALHAVGERIILGIDAKEVGFGNASLPVGAKLADNNTPFAAAPGPVNTVMPPVNTMQAVVHTPPPPPPAYHQILAPSAPILTAKAGGATYEQLIAAGWTDILLRQHGYIAS